MYLGTRRTCCTQRSQAQRVSVLEHFSCPSQLSSCPAQLDCHVANAGIIVSQITCVFPDYGRSQTLRDGTTCRAGSQPGQAGHEHQPQKQRPPGSKAVRLSYVMMYQSGIKAVTVTRECSAHPEQPGALRLLGTHGGGYPVFFVGFPVHCRLERVSKP